MKCKCVKCLVSLLQLLLMIIFTFNCYQLIIFTHWPCSWRDTFIGDNSKIDNLVQVNIQLLHNYKSEKKRLCCIVLISSADWPQCSYWEELHALWTSWDCRLSNVCYLRSFCCYLVNFGMIYLAEFILELKLLLRLTCFSVMCSAQEIM